MLYFLFGLFFAGDTVGYSLAPLNHISRVQENPVSYNNSIELTWLELSSSGSTVIFSSVPSSFYIIPEKKVGKISSIPFSYFFMASCLSHHEMQIINNEGKEMKSSGRIKLAVYLSPQLEVEKSEKSFNNEARSGFIQISPTREGPWTTVRLNYAAPAACWRLGNTVVASEVSIADGNRYVKIRSLVLVRNYTELTLDLQLKLNSSNGKIRHDNDETQEVYGDEVVTDEFFETQKYNPDIGWFDANEVCLPI